MQGTHANIQAPSDLTINNTLFVSKNGNDGTALPDRWDLPFLTINSAQAVAGAGDTIYVFAGNYNEGVNDVIKTDVKYWFELGAILTCNTKCVADFGLAKNIDVDGAGSFVVTALNFGEGVVTMTNSASTLRFRGVSVTGVANGFSLIDGATFDVKVGTITVTNQYAIDIRGNIEGRISFDEIDNSSTAIAIQLRNLGTDAVERKIFINGTNGGLVKADSNVNGVIGTLNTNNTRVYYSDITIDHRSGVAFLIEMQSGLNYFKNINGRSIAGSGFEADVGTGTPTSYLQNCNLMSFISAVLLRDGSSEFVNCELITFGNTAGTGGALTVLPASEASFRDCLIVEQSNTTTRCVINLPDPAPLTFDCRIMNCKLVGHPTMTESIRNNNGAIATSFYVEQTCYTNIPVDVNITNLIVGTNIIVDSQIARLTTNFFE